jgi:hypothetical protein
MPPTPALIARVVFVTMVHLLAGWSLWSPGSAEASVTRPCPDGAAVVSGAGAQDFADICQGVASALSFFSTHGVPAPEPLTIEVTQRLPAEAGDTAAGCYLESQRTVYVVPYASFLTNKTWFGVKIDRAMYRALASHEAAHAVAACRFLIPHPTIQAKEYLAYVAMFSTMPPALRARALKGVPAETFSSFDRFTPMLYMFDPMRFGVSAYRHFSAEPNPTPVIRSVLSGQALTD